MSGLFIALEGMEGSGKSSQLDLLRERLERLVLPVVFSKEPGGTALGAELRSLLLRPHESGDRWCAKSELLLFYADRAQHLESLVFPALAKGHIVVVDRFEDSSWAYQGACGVPEAHLAALRRMVLGEFHTDLTLVLDLEPVVAMQRVSERNGSDFKETRFDSETLAFHGRVREGFRKIAALEPARVRLIDATGDRTVVAERIWAEVAPLLEKNAFGRACNV